MLNLQKCQKLKPQKEDKLHKERKLSRHLDILSLKTKL